LLGEVKGLTMRSILKIARAVGDQNRLRALLALREGELCLCHLIALLELAPSTVSKHLELLVGAGLVQRRKVGRWAYFRFAGRQAPPVVRQALQWILDAVANDPAIAGDAKRLAALRERDVKELAVCYRS
jgi:DNA-binding transcriptional ArsR family regulator